jgi:hypothetical protein
VISLTDVTCIMRRYYLSPITPIDFKPVIPLRIVASSYHKPRYSSQEGDQRLEKKESSIVFISLSR